MKKLIITSLTTANFYFNLIKFGFIGLIAFSIVCILIQIILHPENITFGSF